MSKSVEKNGTRVRSEPMNKAMEAVRAGLSQEDAAARHGVTTRGLRMALRAAGQPPKRPGRPPIVRGRIVISALGPSISEQCKRQGLIAVGKKLEQVDSLSDALTLAYVHGLLTEAEVDRARHRLLKQADIRAAKPEAA